MQLDAGSRSRWKSTIGVVATAALTLAACGTDAGAGGGPGQAIQERLDRGVAMELTIEADPDG